MTADELSPKLHATTDGAVWAEEFCKTFAGAMVTQIESNRLRRVVDPNTMRAWFANAIECGRTAGYSAGSKAAHPSDDTADVEIPVETIDRLIAERRAEWKSWAREPVGEAIGLASMCWSKIGKAGTFRSEQASKIVDELLDRLVSGPTLTFTVVKVETDPAGEAPLDAPDPYVDPKMNVADLPWQCRCPLDHVHGGHPWKNGSGFDRWCYGISNTPCDTLHAHLPHRYGLHDGLWCEGVAEVAKAAEVAEMVTRYEYLGVGEWNIGPGTVSMPTRLCRDCGSLVSGSKSMIERHDALHDLLDRFGLEAS